VPAVAIERGTTADERRVFSTIEHLPEAAKTCELVSPTLIIVGRTVTLSPHWPGDALARARFVEQRGSVRSPEELDDWRVYLDVDLDATASVRAFRDIHVDAAV